VYSGFGRSGWLHANQSLIPKSFPYVNFQKLREARTHKTSSKMLIIMAPKKNLNPQITATQHFLHCYSYKQVAQTHHEKKQHNKVFYMTKILKDYQESKQIEADWARKAELFQQQEVQLPAAVT
jgi:hypothetical protein